MIEKRTPVGVWNIEHGGWMRPDQIDALREQLPPEPEEGQRVTIGDFELTFHRLEPICLLPDDDTAVERVKEAVGSADDIGPEQAQVWAEAIIAALREGGQRE